MDFSKSISTSTLHMGTIVLDKKCIKKYTLYNQSSKTLFLKKEIYFVEARLRAKEKTSWESLTF